jgi:hypothetical protein
MNVATAFISLPEAFELMKPSQTSFNNPASFAQSTTVLGIAFSKQWNYSQLSQYFSQWLTVVGTITLKSCRSLLRTSRLASDCWDSIYKRQCLCNVMPIGSSEFVCQRDTICISNQVMLGACFSPVCGIRASFLPPKTALIEDESTIALEKSIWSALRNWARRIWCILSQTPASCQSRNRRQHVIPLPQPISCGKYSQPMPVLSTNSIPVRAARSETALRPGYRNLRLRFGIIGSISNHNCSSNTGLAMNNLRKIRLLTTSAIYVKNLSFC